MSLLFLLSNIVSWVLVIFMVPLVHQYRLSKEPYTNLIAVSYALMAISLLANSVGRIVVENYEVVIWGGVLTKLLLLVIVVTTLVKNSKIERMNHG